MAAIILILKNDKMPRLGGGVGFQTPLLWNTRAGLMQTADEVEEGPLLLMSQGAKGIFPLILCLSPYFHLGLWFLSIPKAS